MATNFESVFITGCNRGIGLEFVKQFLKLPTPPKYLFATCRSLALERNLELKTLAEDNSNLHVLELEVNDENAINRVASEVDKKLEGTGLNLLINNAGIAGRVTLDETTADRMRDVFKTNVVAPLMLTKVLLPLLRRAVSSDGVSLKPVIVNISSRVGSVEDNTSGRRYAYRASKAALNMVTKSLSIDLANDSIMAVALHPGWVKTDLGGPNGIISTEESVTGLISVICSLDETKNGRFFYYSGRVIPW